MIDEVDILSDLDQLRSRYDVLGTLGSDGACTVYRCRCRGSEKEVAVKVMRNPGASGTRSGALHSWQAHTMKPLDHPGVIGLHAVHHLQGGAVALAMEDGGRRTLGELIAGRGPLPIRQVEMVLRNVAAALAYLHGRGVVHRGVKPDSVLLDGKSGRALLAPFALDRAGHSGAADGRGAITRSLAYLAPEQIEGVAQVEGRKTGVESDLYSLGLIGYAMLTGRQPWAGSPIEEVAAMQKTGALASLGDVREDVPEYLRRAVEGCLEKSPRRRWRSAEAFLSELRPVQSSGDSSRSVEWAELVRRFQAGVAGVRNAVRGHLSIGYVGLGMLSAGVVVAGVEGMEGGPEVFSTNTVTVESAESRAPVERAAAELAPADPVVPSRAEVAGVELLPQLPETDLEEELVEEANPAPAAPERSNSSPARARAEPVRQPSRARDAAPARPAPRYVLLGEPLQR